MKAAGQNIYSGSPRRDGIQVVGAREHNLKGLNVFIPRNKITVITGLSGSGKSTLAFDTIYGEGQRRYLESLSIYARYFIDQMKRAKVDMVYGLSPSIAISQRAISFNPRSTVGTVTEAYDFLRLLFARLGEALCPVHKAPLQSQSEGEILDSILSSAAAGPVMILSPIARGKKGSFAKELSHFLSLGFDRARIDGQWKDLGGFISIEAKKEHTIEILLDHLTASPKNRQRVQKAVETALSLSGGYITVENEKGAKKNYSLHFSCPRCDYSFFDMDPRLFSFNNPRGACRSCNGTGLAGLNEEGEKADGDLVKEACPECRGARLGEDALQVKIKGLNIAETAAMPSEDLDSFLKSLKFKGMRQRMFEQITAPLFDQLSFLKELSIGYLSLDRALSSLSGGEAQRLRLVSQLSSPLIGALYVLDEPSIGLHAKDHGRILDVLKSLRDRGNTVVLVEHDEESIKCADKVIDLGPGAGVHGGFIVAEGALSEIKKNSKSLTGSYMSGKKSIPLYESSYTASGPVLRLEGLSANNLKNFNVSIPLGCLVGISGVSGSGKSTLITDTVYPLLAGHIRENPRLISAGGKKRGRKPKRPLMKQTGGAPEEVAKSPPPACKKASGLELIERVIEINQKPIGKSPRSNPATYMGIFNMIRSLFALAPEARARGYGSGHFSFNVQGGRCEPCMGTGLNKLEMRFLPEVWTVCEFCQGERYQPEILTVFYREKNISDIMKMTVAEAEEFFKSHPHINYRLRFLKNIGLGYLTLGQSSTTLSGGEAQRLKLARELARKNKGHTLYILDEPTTGLHFHDVARLTEILRTLLRQGHSILVIEHNLDVLKSCDYLIDLGPEGGAKGGYIVAEGPPRQVAENPQSHTGRHLKRFFAGKRPAGKFKASALSDGKPQAPGAGKTAKKPSRPAAAKKKPSSARKPSGQAAAKKKPSGKKPSRPAAAKKKPSSARKPSRQAAAKKKPSSAKRPSRQAAAKKKPSSAKRPSRQAAAKKKPSAKKTGIKKAGRKTPSAFRAAKRKAPKRPPKRS